MLALWMHTGKKTNPMACSTGLSTGLNSIRLGWRVTGPAQALPRDLWNPFSFSPKRNDKEKVFQGNNLKYDLHQKKKL